MPKRQKMQRLVFPELARNSDAHPSHCPKCGRPGMPRHRQVSRPVLGADETQVKLSGNGVSLGFLTDPSTGEIVGLGRAPGRGRPPARFAGDRRLSRAALDPCLWREENPRGPLRSQAYRSAPPRRP